MLRWRRACFGGSQKGWGGGERGLGAGKHGWGGGKTNMTQKEKVVVALAAKATQGLL